MRIPNKNFKSVLLFTARPYHFLFYNKAHTAKHIISQHAFQKIFAKNPPNAVLSTPAGKPAVIILLGLSLHQDDIIFNFKPIKPGMFSIPKGLITQFVMTIDSHSLGDNQYSQDMKTLGTELTDADNKTGTIDSNQGLENAQEEALEALTGETTTNSSDTSNVISTGVVAGTATEGTSAGADADEAAAGAAEGAEVVEDLGELAAVGAEALAA